MPNSKPRRRQHLFITGGALFALIGVIARSLSSHAIKGMLVKQNTLTNFNLAADYLLLHGLALIGVALLIHHYPVAQYHRAGYTFIAGLVLFGFSVLTKSLISIEPFGFVTPLGGFLLMTGWALIVYSACTSSFTET